VEFSWRNTCLIAETKRSELFDWMATQVAQAVADTGNQPLQSTSRAAVEGAANGRIPTV
jgi:hypothetical protein